MCTPLQHMETAAKRAFEDLKKHSEVLAKRIDSGEVSWWVLYRLCFRAIFFSYHSQLIHIAFSTLFVWSMISLGIWSLISLSLLAILVYLPISAAYAAYSLYQNVMTEERTQE